MTSLRATRAAVPRGPQRRESPRRRDWRRRHILQSVPLAPPQPIPFRHSTEPRAWVEPSKIRDVVRDSDPQAFFKPFCWTVSSIVLWRPERLSGPDR
jgi:hypothetical protein